MATTNTWSSIHGNIADDHNGHKGTGDTPQHAQEALEQAKAHDVAVSEHKSLTGIIIDADIKKD